jgi:hypothetical protein
LLHVANNDAVYFCCAEDVDPKQALRSPVLAAPRGRWHAHLRAHLGHLYRRLIVNLAWWPAAAG